MFIATALALAQPAQPALATAPPVPSPPLASEVVPRGLVDDALTGFCVMSQPEVLLAAAEYAAAYMAYQACNEAAGADAGSACQDEWEWLNRAMQRLNQALQEALDACTIAITLS